MESDLTSSGVGRPGAEGGGGASPNIATLLRRRREGRIPASIGGGVSGGHASARSVSAAMRGRAAYAGGGGGKPSPFGFRTSVGEHPSMIHRLRHSATLRGHTRKYPPRPF